MYYNVGFGGGRRWLYEVSSRLAAYHDLDFYCIHRSSLGTQFPDERLSRCVLRALRKLVIDPPEGGSLRMFVLLRFDPGDR